MALRAETDTRIVRMKRPAFGVLDYLFRMAGMPDPRPNADFFKDPKNVFLVSRTGGQLSGFLWAHVLVSPHSSGPKLLLYSIDVFGPFRRRGIATFLIRHLKKIARTWRCREMFVPTGRNNLAAVALYRSTGGVAPNDDDVVFVYDREALRA
jgi:ribosomal protein S18 acetylase RimI-like enzyme